VRAAAEDAGREPGAVEIAGMVLVGVDGAERTARSRIAPIVATYLTRFPTLAAVARLPQEEIDGYVALAETDGVAAVAAVLPDEVIDRLTVNGSPARCRERIAEYRNSGLDLPILVAPTDQIEAVIDALGSG
jgi:5,10-methylenetetrahydromethanopterin reductase